MADNFYIVPKMAETRFGAPAFRPKYFPASFNRIPADVVLVGNQDVTWSACDAGESMIVYSPNTAAQHTALSAQADCVAIPPLDNVIGAGALASVKAQIEALNLPAQWVQVGMTYRTVLRVLIGLVQLINAMDGLGQRPTLTGNLGRTIGSLTAAMQAALYSACAALRIDSSGILPATTVRAALFDFGQQFVTGVGVSLGPL